MFNFKEAFVNAIMMVAKNILLGLLLCISGCRCGVGIVFGALVLGLARNPSEEAVCLNMHVRLCFNEAVGLLGLMMAFLLLFS